MRIPLSVLFICTILSAPAAPLTLGEALARVEDGHPWLRTREAVTRQTEARTAIADAQPPPEVSLQLENALGTGELRGARSLETTLQFSRALDWSGRRAARREVAGALGEADRLAWEERRRELLAETARRFIRVAAAQAELTATRELSELAGRTAAALQARAEQAAVAPADLARARLARTEAELEAEHAEHLLLSARQSLATLWGAVAPDFDAVQADLAQLPAVDSYEALAACLGGTMAQARYAALGRWRLAQEKLARTGAARGEPRWAAGLRRVETSDDFGFVFGLSYAWPSPRLADAHAGEARAERERTAAEGETALLEARAVLFELCQELNHARIEHAAARDEMLPTAQAWLAGIEAGAAAGRYGVRDLLEARAALYSARRRQTEAAAEFHTTLVAVEQLLGGPANP